MSIIISGRIIPSRRARAWWWWVAGVPPPQRTSREATVTATTLRERWNTPGHSSWIRSRATNRDTRHPSIGDDGRRAGARCTGAVAGGPVRGGWDGGEGDWCWGETAETPTSASSKQVSRERTTSATVLRRRIGRQGLCGCNARRGRRVPAETGCTEMVVRSECKMKELRYLDIVLSTGQANQLRVAVQLGCPSQAELSRHKTLPRADGADMASDRCIAVRTDISGGSDSAGRRRSRASDAPARQGCNARPKSKSQMTWRRRVEGQQLGVCGTEFEYKGAADAEARVGGGVHLSSPVYPGAVDGSLCRDRWREVRVGDHDDSERAVWQREMMP
ncbi:hypothetical protein C8F01DRAFT_1085242 [Mycena amicta]|nr:hypothetical protein C8F01DRAFT_1085242 [Mycena amicta]